MRVPDAPVLPPALPQRPFGRPEGLQAIAALHGLLAAALAMLPRPLREPPLAPPGEAVAVSVGVQRALGLGTLAACVVLGLAARYDARRIRAGRAAPGRRGRWALVTLVAAAGALALVPLRFWAGRGREVGGFEEMVTYTLLAGAGTAMLQLGYTELRRARRRRRRIPAAAFAGVFGSADPSAGAGDLAPVVAEEGTVARAYAARPRLVAPSGGSGLFTPRTATTAGFHAFGNAPGVARTGAPQRMRVIHVRAETERDAVRRVPGLRVTLWILGGAALWALLARLGW